VNARIQLTRRKLLIGAPLLRRALAANSSGKLARLLICGGNAVYDAALEHSSGSFSWSEVRAWRPERSSGLPLKYALQPFATTDDCKPIDGGANVLVTSSAGGVGIFDRVTHKTTFYAMAANAHSACLLPGGYVAVAASTAPEGNRVMVFHRDEPERSHFSTPLYSAHGVEWDDERRLLYAVGMDVIQTYSWSAPRLVPENSFALPDRGGHELSPGLSDSELIVSTHSRVFVFDKDKGTFAPHPVLSEGRSIKCVSIHRASGKIAYVQPDPGQGIWWTFTLRFLNPEGQLESPGQRIYKVRWA
jgi:hypothetical protein